MSSTTTNNIIDKECDIVAAGDACEPELPPPPPVSSGHWESLSVEIPSPTTTTAPDPPCNCKPTTTTVSDVAQPSNHRMLLTPIQFTNEMVFTKGVGMVDVDSIFNRDYTYAPARVQNATDAYPFYAWGRNRASNAY